MPQYAMMGIAAVSLLDQMFGSGRKRRDQAQQGLDMQQQLAEAQLPDIRRQGELNQTMQDILMQMMSSPELPEQFFSLDSAMQNYLPGGVGMGDDFYSAVGPGLMSGTALDKLLGMTGSTGTGGIQGFANLSNALGQNNEQNFQNTVQSLMEAFLNSKQPVGAANAATWSPATQANVGNYFNQNPNLIPSF